MVKIGVDSSGHVANPPIWFVATRRSKKKGQIKSTLYVSEKKHDELIASFEFRFEKVSAALIYRVVVPIFYEGDVLVIDKDFAPSSEKYIEKYLKKLLRETYPKRPLMANPTIFFLKDIHDVAVKDAHIKTQQLRHKNLKREIKDPSLSWELRKLG